MKFGLCITLGFFLKTSALTSTEMLNQFSPDIHRYIKQTKSQYPNGLEFGFVLLSSKADNQIRELTERVFEVVQPLKAPDLNEVSQPQYHNIKSRFPHISLGQYGIGYDEIEKLKTIVDETAECFIIFEAMMADHLSVTEKNIFFDFQDIQKNTDPEICALYRCLRKNYMEKIESKFMISQALMQKDKNMQNVNEVAFIEKYYQNWGTPEEYRIRPHFTLLYQYIAQKSEIEKALSHIKSSSLPSSITFDQLGIVEIDFWGNPTHVIYKVKLN